MRENRTTSLALAALAKPFPVSTRPAYPGPNLADRTVHRLGPMPACTVGQKAKTAGAEEAHSDEATADTGEVKTEAMVVATTGEMAEGTVGETMDTTTAEKAETADLVQALVIVATTVVVDSVVVVVEAGDGAVVAQGTENL